MHIVLWLVSADGEGCLIIAGVFSVARVRQAKGMHGDKIPPERQEPYGCGYTYESSPIELRKITNHEET